MAGRRGVAGKRAEQELTCHSCQPAEGQTVLRLVRARRGKSRIRARRGLPGREAAGCGISTARPVSILEHRSVLVALPRRIERELGRRAGAVRPANRAGKERGRLSTGTHGAHRQGPRYSRQLVEFPTGTASGGRLPVAGGRTVRGESRRWWQDTPRARRERAQG